MADELPVAPQVYLWPRRYAATEAPKEPHQHCFDHELGSSILDACIAAERSRSGGCTEWRLAHDVRSDERRFRKAAGSVHGVPDTTEEQTSIGTAAMSGRQLDV